MRRFSPAILMILLASVLISSAIALNLWEDLRGGYGWRWPYEVPDRLQEWLPTLIGVSYYVAGCLWLMRRPRALWQIKLWAVMGATLLPFVILTRWGDPMYEQFTRVASGLTSGPHLIAAGYTPATLDEKLKNWTAEQERFAEDAVSIHAALAPPGLPLLYYGANQTLEQLPALADPLGMQFRPMQCHNLTMMQASNAELASAMLGMLSPLWAALAIFPLYTLARRLTDELTACWTILFWAILPGLASFTPVPNTVFPLLSLLIVLLLWQGLVRQNYGLAFSAGVLTFIATFLNISLLPITLFCGLLALGYHLTLARQAVAWWWSVAMGVAFGIGLGGGWLLWLLYGGTNPVAMITTAMNQHLELERAYLPWLVLHLWDYGLFIGLPIFLLLIGGFIRAVRQVWQTRTLTPAGLFALTIGLTLIILDFSGTARGETGRVWQFFFPFSLITAATMLPTATHFRGVLVAQAFCAVVIVVFLAVMGSGLAYPPQTAPMVVNPDIRVETHYAFGDSLRLTGFGGEINSANALTVDLRWQADQWQAQPYWFAILTVAPDGNIVGESYVYQPFADAYPATCWQPGQTVIERVTIPLPGEAQPGDYWLSLSVHDYQDYDKFPVIAPDGTPGDQAGLGPFQRTDERP